jgi:uncharacterized protein YecT (DUF1311 family)
MTVRRISTITLTLAALAAALGPAILSPRADAASFDCASAASPLEKLICSDPTLSQLDEQMAQAYAAKIESLSLSSRQTLKQGQRSWLRRVDAACALPAQSGSAEVTLELTCVAEDYQNRTDKLRASWRVGPFQFVFVESYDAFRIESDDPDFNGKLVTHEVSYPQIDAPRSPEAERWNKQIADWAWDTYGWLVNGPDASPRETEFAIFAQVTFADTRLISVKNGVDWYIAGKPHRFLDIRHSNLWLMPEKEFETSDLFNTATDWRSALASAAPAQIAEQQPDMDWTRVMEDQVADPSYWSISEDALLITFDRGDMHFFVEVSVPWRELKPYLRPDLPLALKLD